MSIQDQSRVHVAEEAHMHIALITPFVVVGAMATITTVLTLVHAIP